MTVCVSTFGGLDWETFFVEKRETEFFVEIFLPCMRKAHEKYWWS